MIGFIGLGAAGGNVADEAVARGIPGIAINYSQKDLESLEHVEDVLKLVGSEGVGKNREEAISLMGKNWESAVSFVKEHYSIPSIEILFVCFSTGGGSGSGMAPVLLEILMEEMPDKTFVAVPIIPDLSEVLINQMNCLRTSEELSRLNLCVLPIDNEQVRRLHPKQGKNKIYKVANETFVSLISKLESYTDKQSKHGVMDKKDFKTILGTKGIGLVAAAEIANVLNTDLSEEGVAASIRKSWEENIFITPQKERIVRAGMVFDGQESMMDCLNYEVIFKGFQSGMPLDLFEGYYHEGTGKVFSILSGLSWYTDRLSKIESIIESKQEATDALMEEREEYQSKVNHLSIQTKKKDTKKRSAKDILSRYKR